MGAVGGEGFERTHLHGECGRVCEEGTGMQFVTDGKEKFIWWPAWGKEQFFDLVNDPTEKHDLAGEADAAARMEPWRDWLRDELAGRPEGFVRDGRLQKIDGPTA